jgi:hypothetical protein
LVHAEIRLERPELGDRRFEMANPRARGDDDTRPSDLRAPREVEVLAEQRHRFVEAAEGLEQVGAHELASAWRGEHVPDPLVLFLIELAPPVGGGDARLVRGHPYRKQADGVVPDDELRRDDARVRAVRLLDQEPDRVRLGSGIVVEEDVMRRTLDHAQDVVGGRGKPPIGVQPAHVRRREDGGNPAGRVLGARRVDDQDREVGVVGVPHRSKGFLQPRPGIVGNNDDDHRRDGRCDRCRRIVTQPAGVGLRRRTHGTATLLAAAHQDRAGVLAIVST